MARGGTVGLLDTAASDVAGSGGLLVYLCEWFHVTFFTTDQTLKYAKSDRPGPWPAAPVAVKRWIAPASLGLSYQIYFSDIPLSRFQVVDSIFSAIEKRLGSTFLVQSWQAVARRSSTPG